MKRLHLAFIVVIISFTVTACSGLRMGVGLKGEIIEGDTIYQTYTPCDMTSEEASIFWKHIFSIPI